MQPVTILYEDQQSPLKEFGPHRLVKACVADVLVSNGEPRHLIERALKDHRPLKGDTKLLVKFREDVDLIAKDGRPVFAVFDNDKIRQRLKLPANASEERVAKEIRKGSSETNRLFLIFLKENMESVLVAARKCDPSINSERFLLATVKKDPLERDTLLLELSAERFRAIRDCILKELPSLHSLIELLCTQLQSSAQSRKKR